MQESDASYDQPLRRGLTLLALIAAGEAAFLLPFLIARVFRPTVLEVFAITNLELGAAYSAYGLIAMLAYIAGGPLADRFPARGMLLVALLTTAAGGVLLSGIPALGILVALYVYWGITTIALFWAPLIRATREWGGASAQGRAFGLLDGGRGLLAAAVGSLLVAVFAAWLPVDPELASLAERTAALQQIIFLLILITAGIAILIWFALPADSTAPDPTSPRPEFNIQGLLHVVRLPAVWWQALIILCAYVGFRSIDDFSLYANEVLGMNEVDAAKVGLVPLWVRPIAAVGAGLLADRLSSGRMTLFSFVLIGSGSAVLASGVVVSGALAVFLISVGCASLGIFGLRGLYFAIMQEGRIPLAFTGSAVGLVSLIGYTPDIFMAPLMGYLLDASPGAAGHQHVFWVVTGFSVLGLIASLAFQRSSAASVR